MFDSIRGYFHDVDNLIRRYCWLRIRRCSIMPTKVHLPVPLVLDAFAAKVLPHGPECATPWRGFRHEVRDLY